VRRNVGPSVLRFWEHEQAPLVADQIEQVLDAVRSERR
jgi:hypothetical protein